MDQIKEVLSGSMLQIVNHLDEILFLHDVDLTKMIYVSPAYERLWGKTCQSLYDDPRSFLASIHPSDRFYVESEISNKRFKNNEKEYRIIRPDGTMRWIQDRTFPIKDPDGNMRNIAGIARDVSKQIFSEKMLRLKEQRYRALFNSCYDAVLVCNFRKEDLSDSLIEVNDIAVRLTGYSRNELMMRSLSDLVPDSERQNIPLIIDNLFHRQNFVFETSLKTKYGYRLPVEINANLFSLANQPALIFIVRDISERKTHEQQIREYHENMEKMELQSHIRRLYQRMIKHVEDEKKKIALEIHDEIGQLLTVMQLEMESLENNLGTNQSTLKGKCRKVLGYLEKLGNSAREISSNLRPDILDNMGLIPAIKWYIGEFTKRHPDIKTQFISRGVKNKRFNSDTEIAVYRIIQEGLANIFAHSKAEQVVISITCSHPNLILKIADNGIGFDIQKASLKAYTEKRGLGLTAIKERVAFVGGSVKIRSLAGKGSVIRAVLPTKKGSD